MAEPHPIPKHSRFIDLTGQTMASGVQVIHFLGQSRWLCRCKCGREFEAGGDAVRLGKTIRCRECRQPSVKPAEKTCTQCGITHPYTNEFFTACKQQPFGLRAACKKCVNKKTRPHGKIHKRRLRMRIYKHYCAGDPACACCGETTYEFLSLDHLEGSSQEDYRKHKTAVGIMINIIREGFPPKYRVLCHNCNQCCRVYGHCVHNPKTITFHRMLTKPDMLLQIPDDITDPAQVCIKCKRRFPHTKDFFPRNAGMPRGLLRCCKDCDRYEHRTQCRIRKAKQKLIVFRHYCQGKPRCACCGLETVEFLCIDHINGGGQKHRKEINTGNFYHWLIKSGFPAGFQTLCYNCNMAKGFYGQCPH